MVPCPAGAKKPSRGGFGRGKSYSAKPGDFRRTDRIAVLTGPCEAAPPGAWLVCLDLDGALTRKQAATALSAQLPATLATHKGKHLWYYVSPCEERDHIRQWNGVLGVRDKWAGEGKAPDLDLKWDGGYAIEASPEEFDLGRVVELPRKALRGILTTWQARRPAVTGEPDAELPTAAALEPDAEAELIEALIEEWPDAGSGRHDAAKALGGALRRAGIDRRSAERVAAAVQDGVDSDQPLTRIRGTLDAWDRTDRGEPAFGLAMLRSLCGGAERVAAALAACTRPSSALLSWLAARARAGHPWARAALADAEDPDAGDMVIVPAAELFKDLPPTDWLCEKFGLAVGGRPHVLAAEAGAGKSWTAMALALAVATGGELFGGWQCKQGSVLCLDADQGLAGTGMRLQWLARGLGLRAADMAQLPIGAVFFDACVVKGEAVDPKAVARLERAVKGRTLCVIDSLAQLGAGIDEKDSRLGLVLAELTRITQVTGTTWLVLHHSGKAEGTEVRGTSAIRDRAGAVWLLRRGESEVGTWDQNKVSELATVRSERFSTRLETHNVERWARIELTAAPEIETGAPTDAERAAVAAYIAERNGACGEKQIIMHLRTLGPGRAKDVIAVMKEEGQIERAGGQVDLTPAGRELL